MHDQQKQTKKFFDEHVNKWHKQSNVKSKNVVNVIKHRNEYVKKTIHQFYKKPITCLDVGCGTGNLTIELLKNHHDAYGIDFSSEMIKKAKNQAKKQKLSINNFYHNSIFDLEFKKKFDLISANGFIEYISSKQLDEFIIKCRKLLKVDGILVIGSRNRLFNMFSLNKFSQEEIKNGNFLMLANEAILLNNIKNFNELKKSKFKQKIPRNLEKHEFTGVNVDTRYQYTPIQLMRLLERKKFKVLDIKPIHIHVLTTGAKSLNVNIHNKISNFLYDNQILPIQALPIASSFMITAKKS